MGDEAIVSHFEREFSRMAEQLRKADAWAAKDRRDRFAMAALTGLRAAGDPTDSRETAKIAVLDADALIAELDKGER